MPPSADPGPAGARRRASGMPWLAAGLGAGLGAAAIVVGLDGLGATLQLELDGLGVGAALTLPVLAWLTILAHELGHLLGGALAGLRPLMLFVGPLHLERTTQGWRPRFNRVASTWGGLAVCAPSTAASRGSFAAMLLGGPLASFAFAMALALAATAMTGAPRGVLALASIVSAGVGVVTLLPLPGVPMGDGGQLLALWRRAGSTQLELALSAVVAQSHAGVRPRALDAELVALLSSPVPPSDRMHRTAVLLAAAALVQAHVALDRGAYPRAAVAYRSFATQLERGAWFAMPAGFRQSMALSLVVWLAQHAGDAAAARAWWQAARGHVADAAFGAYADAALAHAEGRDVEALAHVEVARRALPMSVDRGTAAMLADGLDALELECRPTR